MIVFSLPFTGKRHQDLQAQCDLKPGLEAGGVSWGVAQASINEAQKCPEGEVPLVFVPVGTPGGHPSNQK